MLRNFVGFLYDEKGEPIMNATGAPLSVTSEDFSPLDLMNNDIRICYAPFGNIGVEFEAAGDIVKNANLLKQPLDNAKQPSYNVEYVKRTQKRTHRKRRINKKWAKRYGFKEEKVTLHNLKLESCEVDKDSLVNGELIYNIGFKAAYGDLKIIEDIKREDG